jgi:hypothetical protein
MERSAIREAVCDPERHAKPPAGAYMDITDPREIDEEIRDVHVQEKA